MMIAILGCGYVGQAIAHHWQQEGLTVTATTTTPSRVTALSAYAQQVQVVRGDDPAGVRSLLQGQDTLLISVGAPRADAYAKTYLATAQTIAAVVSDLPDLRQIIYTGSYAVYGDRQGAWVTEETPIVPTPGKSEVLYATEQILLGTATPTRSVCVFRLGGICGPGREIVKIFRSAAGTTRPGTGQDMSNWIHLDDIVGAIAFAHTHHLNGIYNLVHDQPLTQKELLDRVFTHHHLPLVAWDPAVPSTRPYNAKVSNQKLRQAGYSFRYTAIPIE